MFRTNSSSRAPASCVGPNEEHGGTRAKRWIVYSTYPGSPSKRKEKGEKETNPRASLPALLQIYDVDISINYYF